MRAQTLVRRRGNRKKEGQAALIAAVGIVFVFLIFFAVMVSVNNAHFFYEREETYAEFYYLLAAKESLNVTYYSGALGITNTGQNPSTITAVVGVKNGGSVFTQQTGFTLQPGASCIFLLSNANFPSSNGNDYSVFAVVTSLGNTFSVQTNNQAGSPPQNTAQCP